METDTETTARHYAESKREVVIKSVSAELREANGRYIDCRSHREWKPPGEQSHLNLLSIAHIRQRFKQQARGRHKSVPCPLHVYILWVKSEYFYGAQSV